MGFKRDLRLGEKVEGRLVEILKKEFPTLKQIKKYFSGYDLVDDDGYSIEVKFDKKSEETGNTAIEYEYKGKPSGINCTKAMEWIQVYYLNDQWVYSRIKAYNLKAYIDSNKEYFSSPSGGDNKSSKMVLINSQDFADRFDFRPIN